MRAINFRGLRPKHSAQKLASGFGQIAENLDIYSGDLRGFNAPDPVSMPRSATTGLLLDAKARTLYRAGATWVGWADHTFVVPDPTGEPDWAAFVYVEAGRLMWQTEQRMLQGCAPVALGTCPPSLAPTAYTAPSLRLGEPSMPLACVTDAAGQPCLPEVPELRAYCHTWVRKFPCCTGRMEESAPSPPVLIDVLNTDGVMLSPEAAPPEGVTHARWYREIVGTKGGSVWLLAGEVAVPTGRFLDDLRPIELGAPLETVDHYPPPACHLEGVALLGDAQILVWEGRTAWASQPHAPGAFDLDRQVYRLPYRIVGAIGITNMLEQAETFETHVATDGKPYRLTSNRATSKVEVLEVQAHQPCISVDSLCDMHGRSGWATPYGFVRFSGEGFEVVSDAYWTEQEWRQLEPARMRAVFWHERLWMGWPDRGGYCLGLAPDDGARPRTLVSFTPRVAGWYTRADLALFLSLDAPACVAEWGRGAPMLWRWRSEIWVTAELFHPTAVKVVGTEGWTWHDQGEGWLRYSQWLRDGRQPQEFFERYPAYRHLRHQWLGTVGHTITVLRGHTPVARRHAPDSRPLRVPRLQRHTEWAFEICGVTPVREIHLTNMMVELSAVEERQ